MKSTILSIILVLFTTQSLFAKITSHFAPEVDLETETITQFMKARSSIDIAIYTFSSAKIRSTLLKKMEEGVRVRILINKGNTESVKSFMQPLFEKGAMVRYLTVINHHKFAIIDGNDAERSQLLNSSGNFSGSPRSKKYDENLVVCDALSCATQIGDFADEFESLLLVSNPVFGDNDAVHLNFPRGPVNENSDVSLFTSGNFYPRLYRGKVRLNKLAASDLGYGKLDQVLIEAIDNAEKEILIATGHLRSYPLFQALKRAALRDVTVKMVLDGQEYISKYKQRKESSKVNRCLAIGKSAFTCHKTGIHFARLAHQAGMDVRLKYYMIRWHFPHAKQMHHKYMVVDGNKLYSGSYNWSYNAEFQTLENVAIYQNKEMIAAFTRNFNKIRNYGQGSLGVKSLLTKYRSATKQIPLVFAPISATINEIDQIKRLARSKCSALYTNPLGLFSCKF